MKHPGLLSFVLIGLAANAAHAQKTADAFLKAGQAQYSAFKIDEAITSFSECIRVDPKAHLCFFGRGKAYHGGKLFSEENYEKSIADYGEAIRLKPDFAEAYQQRALRYFYGKGDYANAYLDLVQQLKFKPKAQEAAGIQGLLGEIYMTTTVIDGVKGPNYAKAIESFTRAIKLDTAPDSYSRPAYFGGRAAAHLGAGAIDKAIADISEAIKLKPKDHFEYHRAMMLEKKGDYEKALQDLDVYISNWGSVSIPAFQLRASVRCRLGRADLAADDEAMSANLGLPVASPCKKDASSKPTTTGAIKAAEHHFAEGNRLGKAKDLDGAIASFTQCIAANAGAFPCFLHRGVAHAQKGSTDAAMIDFSKAIELKPDFAKAFVARGNLHLKLRKKELAASDFRAALKLEPGHSQATRGLKAAEAMK